MPMEIYYVTLEHVREKMYIVYHRYDKQKPVEYRTYYPLTTTVFEYYEKHGGKKEDFEKLVFPPRNGRITFPPENTTFHLTGKSYELTLVHEEGKLPLPEIENEVVPLRPPNDGRSYHWEGGKWIAA